MVQSIENLVQAFDKLSLEDQATALRVLQERMKPSRSVADNDIYGEITEEDLTLMADQTFQALDEQERQHGTSESW